MKDLIINRDKSGKIISVTLSNNLMILLLLMAILL